jgi:hypothetical protein
MAMDARSSMVAAGRSPRRSHPQLLITRIYPAVDDTTDGGAPVGPDPMAEIMEIGSRSSKVEDTWVNKKEENGTPYAVRR